MAFKITPELKELLSSKKLASTGRIKNFLYHPERKTHAPSCMLRVYRNDLAKELAAISHYLRKGAGVKVQLEEFRSRKPISVKFHFYINPEHPDYHKITPNQESMLVIPGHRGTWLSVEDSMESIEQSWTDFIDAASRGESIIVDLSQLRPGGTTNPITGLVATGPLGMTNSDEGFLSVYYWLAEHLEQGDITSLIRLLGGLCKVLARGGTHKNGIVTTAIDYRHPDVLTYLNFPLTQVLGGSKKGLRLDQGILDHPELCKLVVDRVNSESLMLEKIVDPNTYLNVCQGIELADKASCLISHANAGQCQSPKELLSAYTEVVRFLCLIHQDWREAVNADPELYLPQDDDRQIGAGWLGWANFLRMMKVSYADHADAMRDHRLGIIGKSVAAEIAVSIWQAHQEAAKIAAEFGLDRFCTIEPTQRCYRDYQDLEGYITCRNIDPPFSQWQQRDSAVHGDELLYHGPVETIAEVGHTIHQLHWEEWQHMMNATGKAHAMSFDLYQKIDLDWFKNFVVNSPLISTYYQMSEFVDQSYLDKGLTLIAIDEEKRCLVCGE